MCVILSISGARNLTPYSVRLERKPHLFTYIHTVNYTWLHKTFPVNTIYTNGTSFFVLFFFSKFFYNSLSLLLYTLKPPIVISFTLVWVALKPRLAF